MKIFNLNLKINESISGYTCPFCGKVSSEESFIIKSETEFKNYPDPHYEWDEIHKCSDCKTLYLIHNGT